MLKLYFRYKNLYANFVENAFMEIQYFHVNSFTGEGFRGNPAGVCLLDNWIREDLMQSIAFENNLSETAFIVKNKSDYDIRWFTPKVEVDLCGHATLAGASVIMEKVKDPPRIVRFNSRSGMLSVEKAGTLYRMNFPVDELNEINIMTVFSRACNEAPLQAFRGKTDYLLIYHSEEQIRNMVPDFKLLGTLDSRGVIVTAPGKKVDFVSRFFGPQSGIPEDPVTGSAHTSLAPYWAGKLGKDILTAWQLSERGGKLLCHLKGNRVEIEGGTTFYLSGLISI
jgi:predicted PhzF superfamily epimerase YddE/YHI9